MIQIPGWPSWFDTGIAFVVSASMVLIAVPVVRTLAWRFGAVDHPGGRRIHPTPVPRLGGLAILLGFFAGLAAVVGRLPDPPIVLGAVRWSWAALGMAALMLLLVGARDDLRGLSPWMKLVFEALAAVVVLIAFPIRSVDLGLFTIPASLSGLSAVLAVVWVTTVTNAYNMVDGLDGLASGVGAIAAAAMAVVAWTTGNPLAALALTALCGSLAAFLLYNGQPARIFMGDSGSLSVGFLLAALGLVGFRSGDVWYAVPAVAALAVPLLDLATAVVRRLFESLHVVRVDHLKERFALAVPKRPQFFTADGRHIHHRLLALGFSRRATVLAMYGAGAVFGFLGIASRQWAQLVPVTFVLVVSVTGFLCSRWLYEELRLLRRGLLLPLYNTRFALRRINHALLDAVAFGLAFIAARWILQVDGAGSSPVLPELLLGAAVTSGVATGVFWGTGIYQLTFRRAGTWTLTRLTVAVLLATLAAMTVEALLLASSLQWSAWVLTAYFAATLTIGARLSYRVLDGIHQRSRPAGRRVAFLGAGRGGSAALREVLENPGTNMQAVGFVDDDPYLWNKCVEGLRVYPGGSGLARSIAEMAVDALVISSRKLPPEREVEVRDTCRQLGVALMRADISIEPFPSEESEPTESLEDAVSSLGAPFEVVG